MPRTPTAGLESHHSHDHGEPPVPDAYSGIAAHNLENLDNVVWVKSSYSNSQGTCAEFARLPGGDVAVRNSRDPEGPALVYTPAEVQALLLGVKDGEFDYLIA